MKKAAPGSTQIPKPKATPGTVQSDSGATFKIPPKPPFFGGTQEDWEAHAKAQLTPEPKYKPMTAKKKATALTPGQQAVVDGYIGTMNPIAMKAALGTMNNIISNKPPHANHPAHSAFMQEKFDSTHMGLQSLIKNYGASESVFESDGVEGVVKTTLLKALRSGKKEDQLSALAYANHHEVLEELAEYEEDYGQGGGAVEEWHDLLSDSPLAELTSDPESLYSLLKKGEAVSELDAYKIKVEKQKLSKAVVPPGSVNLKEEADKALSSPENREAFDALPDEQKQHMVALGGLDKIQEKFKSTPWARKDSAQKAEEMDSSEHKKALTKYTGGAYKKINGSLRVNNPLNPDLKNQIDTMTDALKSSPSTEDLLLVRGVTPTPEMLQSMGLPGKAFGSDFMDSIRSKVGTSFVDPGFGSSSFQHDNSETGRAGFVGPGNLNLRILAPKGTEMSNIHSISNYQSENEILLQRGTAFTIAGGYRDSKGLWWMDVVVTNQGG